MGLSSRLARRAVEAAHVLVVEAPGAWLTRVAVEQALVRRGWRTAMSPADADVLVVCGHLEGRLLDATERTWSQLPGPRARAVVLEVSAVESSLDEAARVLVDDEQQRADGAARTTPPDGHETIPLATSGGLDRDGLEMDALHLPLGPVLPCWPSGLLLRVTVQGDVVTGAEIDWLEPAAPLAEPESLPTQAARLCDSAAGLLTLAGWDSAAAQSRHARDALLSETGPAVDAAAVERLRARVSRSRMVRWSLRDLGRLDDDEVAGQPLPEHLRGDVRDRLLRQLEMAGERLRPKPDTSEPGLVAAWLDRPTATAVVPALATGLDLAAVRLVVASLVPLASTPAAQGAPGSGHV